MALIRMFFSSIGRACMSFIFFLGGISKILDFDQSLQSLGEQIIVLPKAFAIFPWLDEWIMELSGHTSTLLTIAIVFEILGGILLFLGWRARFGAFLLILFLVPASLIFHHFWDLQGPDRNVQMIMFLKNVSIFGGLLYVLVSPKKCGKPQVKQPAVSPK